MTEPPTPPVTAEADTRALDAITRISTQAADEGRNYTYEEMRTLLALQGQRDTYSRDVLGREVPADDPATQAGWEWRTYGEATSQIDGRSR